MSASNIWWLEQTEAEVPTEDDWLSEAEAAKLAELRFSKRRADWRLGRWTAKLALASYLNLPNTPAELRRIEIRPAPSGAPEALLSGQAPPATISISHSGKFAMCTVAASHVELGCDIEMLEAHDDALVRDYFTEQEQQAVSSQRTDQARVLATMLVWTAKESAMKALKAGLRLSTHDFSVSFGDLPDNCPDWQPVSVQQGASRTFFGWWQQSGELVRTIVAASASRPPVKLLTTCPQP